MASTSSSDSISTNVIGGLITAGVLAGVAAVWKYAPGTWKRLTDLVAAAWAYLLSPATIPTWWLLILSLAGLLVVGFAVVLAYVSLKDDGPKVTDYQEDQFFGAVWRWRFTNYGPMDTWAFCPGCDTALVYSEVPQQYGNWGVALRCETCEREVVRQDGDKDHLVAKVVRQIDRRVRSGEWKAAVAKLQKTA